MSGLMDVVGYQIKICVDPECKVCKEGIAYMDNLGELIRKAEQEECDKQKAIELQNKGVRFNPAYNGDGIITHWHISPGQ